MTRRRTRKSASPQVDRFSDANIIAMSARYEELKGVEAAAEKEAKTIQKQILEEMKLRGVEHIDWPTGRVTRTAAKRFDISIDVLSELLPTRIFNKITTRAIDKSLLSSAVQSGVVDKEIVAKATTIGENAPYIRISHGSGD